MSVQSDFLFARPSLLSGIARLFDLWGLFDSYNTSDSADARATYADWRIVGEDLIFAMDEFDAQQAEEGAKQGELFTSVNNA